MVETNGIPLPGDRSAYRARSYPERHSEDLAEETYEHHTPLSNLAATTAPTQTDDNTQGYAVGSMWIDTVTNSAYVCVDATTGFAVWVGLYYAATQIGEVFFSVDGATLTAELPLTDAAGWLVDEEAGVLLGVDTPEEA